MSLYYIHCYFSKFYIWILFVLICDATHSMPFFGFSHIGQSIWLATAPPSIIHVVSYISWCGEKVKLMIMFFLMAKSLYLKALHFCWYFCGVSVCLLFLRIVIAAYLCVYIADYSFDIVLGQLSYLLCTIVLYFPIYVIVGVFVSLIPFPSHFVSWVAFAINCSVPKLEWENRLYSK